MTIHRTFKKARLHLALVYFTSLILLVNTLPIHSQSSMYQEAPMLAEQVKAGNLPPVDDRLPPNPLVLQPQDKVGIYGGTWHVAMAGDDRNFTYRVLGYEPLVRWDPEWTHVMPNVAQSYEVNDDATKYTFHLRQGIHWSDGEPFTADDILFWYEAVVLNKELTPAPLSWLKADGKLVVVEKQDDYTLTFSFAAPSGLFLQRLATAEALEMFAYPHHYMSQFHADYNPKVADLVAKEGVKTWVELFQKKVPFKLFPINWEAPSLNPWILAEDYFKTKNTLHAVRNPHYWKVDTDFNQLPYIDHVEFALVKDRAAINELAVKGQIDMQLRAIDPIVADPKNMQQGDYHTIQGIPTNSTSMVLVLNLNHFDPTKREIFQNHDFRVGLSYAIDRTKTGSLEPAQVAPVRESPLYNEKFAKQYTEYDVQKANEYLDTAGYKARDAEGFRLRPDGKRISFTIIAIDPVPGVPNSSKLLAIILDDWKAVGVEATVQTVTRLEAETAFSSNQFDAAVWGGDGGFEAILEPRYYFPFSVWSLYAPLWAKWFMDPTDPQAEQPPAIVQQQMTLYGQLQATTDPDKQIAIMKEIINISMDQFYAIGLNRPSVSYGVVKNNFHNVLSSMPTSYSYPEPGPTNPSQYYIDPQP